MFSASVQLFPHAPLTRLVLERAAWWRTKRFSTSGCFVGCVRKGRIRAEIISLSWSHCLLALRYRRVGLCACVRATIREREYVGKE